MQRIFKKIIDFYNQNKSVLLYLIFGGLTTFISIFTFILFNEILNINELIANVFSWIFAVLFAFFTNKNWVFHSDAAGKRAFQEGVSFFAGRLSTLGIEEVIMLIFVTWLNFSGTVVKVAAQVVVLVLNYLISKFLVFRGKSE